MSLEIKLLKKNCKAGATNNINCDMQLSGAMLAIGLQQLHDQILGEEVVREWNVHCDP